MSDLESWENIPGRGKCFATQTQDQIYRILNQGIDMGTKKVGQLLESYGSAQAF